MKNIFDLTGKNALVVGGAGGIGQSIAKGLAFYGANVAIASRKMEHLEKAAQEIEAETGKSIKLFQVDASDEASILNLTQEVLASMGRLDILVNSQGLNIKHPTTEFPMNEWDQVFNVNVKGLMMLSREFAKDMIKNKSGRIINVSSIRGARAIRGNMGNTAYCASKGAVNMMTMAMASEFAQHNVTVNAIAPTLTETPMMVKFLENDAEGKARLLSSIPLGRLGLTDDCIGPVIFLASDAGSFFTGQVLYPDGGQSIIS